MTEQAHEPGPNQIKRQRLTTVTVERPRCPACGGIKLHQYRTLADQGPIRPVVHEDVRIAPLREYLRRPSRRARTAGWLWPLR